jgi:chromosome segregation ATPase
MYDEIGQLEEEIERLDETIVTLLADNDSLRTTIDRLRDELEREQMRLAACGVVAMANTPDTAAKARDILPEYRSASCDDVARIVDENMKLRAAIERVRALCDKPHQFVIAWEVLRALDGEDA